MRGADGAWEAGPEDPRLGQNEVHVWRVHLDAPNWPRDRLRTEMTPDETQRADAFHFEKHRRRFVVARGTLRRILARYLGTRPETVRFRYGRRGKPALSDAHSGSRLRFNLSHSHGLALCAVAVEREIGVDVEQMRERVEIDRIAERFFSAAENAEYFALETGLRREAFYRIWTRKEAYLKAIGEGLFRSSTGFDVSVQPRQPARLLRIDGSEGQAARWELRDLDPADGFVGAVLAEGSGWSLTSWRLDP